MKIHLRKKLIATGFLIVNLLSACRSANLPAQPDRDALARWGNPESTAGIQARLGKGPEYALAVSPDGRTIAISGLLSVTLLRFDSLKEIWTSPLGPADPQIPSPLERGDVAWSPDGKRLATLSDAGITVWDARTGKQLQLFKHDIRYMAFIGWSQGRLVAWRYDNSQGQLLDAETGEPLFSLPEHTALSSWDWLPGGEILAAGVDSGTISMLDLGVNPQSHPSIDVCERYCIFGLKLSPDGTRVAAETAGEGGRVIAWNARTGEQLFTIARPDRTQAEATLMAWSPDDAYLAAAFSNREILIWDGRTGKQLQRLKRVQNAAQDTILDLAWSRDGRQLISMSRYAPVTVWDVRTGKAIRALNEHGSWVLSLAWSPDGGRLAAGYEDGEVVMWRSPGRQKLWSSRDPSGWVRSLAWSPDGSKLASAGTNTVTLWESGSGKRRAVWPVNTLEVTNLTWSPDGSRLAAQVYDGTVIVWDAASGHKVLELPSIRFGVGIAWSPQGDLLGTSYPIDEQNRVQITLWDANTGQPVRTMQGLYELAWSPQGNVVASVSDSGTANLGDDKTLVLWNARTGQVVFSYTNDFYLDSLSWSPDENYLVVGHGEHNTLFIVDARTGRPIHSLAGHADMVTGVAWSPRGDLIASASWDGTVILWKVEAH